MRLVDLPAGQAGHQRVIANLITKPRHHRRHLGVEQRPRHIAEQQHENLDVLPRGMKHLHHSRIGQQQAKRCQIQSRRKGINHRHLAVRRELNHAQLGPIGPFAHEFGINGHESLVAQPFAQGGEGFG